MDCMSLLVLIVSKMPQYAPRAVISDFLVKREANVCASDFSPALSPCADPPIMEGYCNRGGTWLLVRPSEVSVSHALAARSPLVPSRPFVPKDNC